MLVSPERIAKGMYWERPLKLVEGCSYVSDGCKNCWSAREAYMRSKQQNPKIHEQYAGLTNEDGRWNGQIRLMHKNLALPLQVKKPTVWAVWNDLFHEDVPDEFIDLAFGAMALSQHHTFIVLTKRPDRMMDYMRAEITHTNAPIFGFDEEQETYTRGQEIGMHLRGCGADALWNTKAEYKRKSEIGCAMQYHGQLWPMPNVYLGVTAENQQTADERIPILLKIPAAVRFVSVEPMLSEVDLIKYLPEPKEYIVTPANCLRSQLHNPLDDLNKLSWVICGAEVASKARPMDEKWVKDLCNQCVSTNVPFFYKQKVENGKKISLPELGGKRWAEFPQTTV